jgi:hypothetical protein
MFLLLHGYIWGLVHVKEWSFVVGGGTHGENFSSIL